MSKFFQASLDSASIRSDLLAHDHTRQLNAVKQVIAHMVIGKDMSMHYNDVANLLSSPDLHMKKMVYLYLMQNSKSQPEKAVLQAGTLVHDTNHSSPLIRGIALRTMSSMLVPAMVDFLHPPVVARLRDPDPYVRRNAAFACLKLFTIAPDICKQTKLLEALEELLGSSTASVVASAVCVITEIVRSPNAPTNLQTTVASHALSYVASLELCGEWPQLYLLEGIAQLFQQKAPIITLEEAEAVTSRVVPLLCSMNVAVCMAAFKVVITMLLQFTGPGALLAEDLVEQLNAKYVVDIVEPMLTLVCSTKAEIRYVAFRNLKLLLNVGPTFVHAFTPHLPSLFVKFDDPIYIKLEKVDTMLTLATHDNARRVLAELSEYATELDEQLARKAVQSIGVLAVKLECIVDDSLAQLVCILDSSIKFGLHSVAEAAGVLQTIFRQYPDRFNNVLRSFPLKTIDSDGNEVDGIVDIIQKLCQALDYVTDPDSRAAIIWVIGEYANDDAAGTLSLFFDTFAEESVSVQLAVLTAVAKTYIKSDEATKAINLAALTEVLGLCKASEVPDVRDRAFFYWRLISTNIKAASMVLLAHKPGMLVVDKLERSMLTELLSQAGNLSSIVHQPVSALLGENVRGKFEGDAPTAKDDSTSRGANVMSPSDPFDVTVDGGGIGASSGAVNLTSPTVKGDQKVLSMLAWQQVLEASGSGKGLTAYMGWSHGATGPQLHTRFNLDRAATVSSSLKVTTMQINVNLFGLGISQAFPETTLKAGDAPVVISLAVGANNQRKPVKDLQVALKVEPIGVLFFVAPPIPMHLVLQPATGCDPTKYAAEFESASVGWQLPADVPPIPTSNGRLSGNALRLLSLNLVHTKEISQDTLGLHIYASTIAGQQMCAIVTVKDGYIASAIIRGSDVHVCPPFGEYLLASLAN